LQACVRPSYRRQGIGENLLRKGIEIAQHHFHAQNIWIEVVEGNEPAFINYYGQLKDLLILKWGPSLTVKWRFTIISPYRGKYFKIISP